MNGLASALSPYVARVVVDRTDLAGLYDFTLTWTPDQLPQAPPDARPVGVSIIDRAERPTGD
jgi:uncharacterized protein (TIGR03435 family)